MLDIGRQNERYDRGKGPYPERRVPEPNALDRFIVEMYGRAAALAERGAATLARQIPQIEKYGERLTSLTDEQLRTEVEAMRRPLLREGFQRDLVAQAFALVRETSARRLGRRHYPVQLMGGLTLMQGRLAEMQTGEGKTLTASLAAATAALSGAPVHVITVNDYLAERDADDMRPLYEGLGLSVGFVKHGLTPAQRRAAYGCDVTYAANKEVAFDYLKDGLALGRRRSRADMVLGDLAGRQAGEGLLLRGLCFAIVDEADSVLIDEARTPLIISGAAGDGSEEEELYATALALSQELKEKDDYILPPGARAVRLTDDGNERLRVRTAGFGGLWEARRGREELVQQALAARLVYERDRHYVVVDGKVQIVDEYTGRIADGRQWQNGLHQLIELKEGVKMTPQNRTQASITYQRFFRRYLHLCGMSGTLAETAGELRAVYGLKTTRIPTHRPSQRLFAGARLYHEADGKRDAIVAAAARESAAGRPVLIGTRSVAESDLLSNVFQQQDIAHVVLNARHDKEEAEIVAQAGQPGRITVATNMAGRGTDIKLSDEARASGGLHVIVAEYCESSRVDRQLIGRGGRQGDPSTYEIVVALDDELFGTYARWSTRLLRRLLMRDRAPHAARWAALLQRLSQRHAENIAYAARRDTLRSQRQLDKSLGFAGSE